MLEGKGLQVVEIVFEQRPKSVVIDIVMICVGDNVPRKSLVIPLKFFFMSLRIVLLPSLVSYRYNVRMFLYVFMTSSIYSGI